MIHSLMIEQGLAYHETHYTLYRGWVFNFLWVKWSNQQCQNTEGR